jgi:2-phospho-L-lactate/phosphoenolpyruvate guanylyltransferase
MLLRPPLVGPPPLDPWFGSGSVAAHARVGAVCLIGDWPTLRRDVDTAGDLAIAATPRPRSAHRRLWRGCANYSLSEY